VDVEQIMRDIRSRISRRHGVDLKPQQIQELAARRLEAILEPRHVKPALLEQMRRAAGETIEVPAPRRDDARMHLDEAALYESHRGFLRLLRRWLNPILKLFFNPAPLVQAVNAQADRAAAAAAREAELATQQAEWNALHYEILQRLVTEVSRTTIEMQDLGMRMESLAAKVDFNERRVRGLENTGPQARPVIRTPEHVSPAASPQEGIAHPVADAPAPPAGEAGADGPRRRRRRRRGRRSGALVANDGTTPVDNGAAAGAADNDLEGDLEGDDVEPGDTAETLGEGPVEQTATALEPAHAFSLLQPVERHPSDVPADAGQPPPSPAQDLEASAPATPEPAVREDPAPSPPEPPADPPPDTGERERER
jgi:hypothetical protein